MHVQIRPNPSLPMTPVCYVNVPTNLMQVFNVFRIHMSQKGKPLLETFRVLDLIFEHLNIISFVPCGTKTMFASCHTPH